MVIVFFVLGAAECNQSSRLFMLSSVVADLMFIPLNMLGQMFHHHAPLWSARFSPEVAAELSHKFLVFKDVEVWLDALFIADLLYKLARAMVRDLGHDASPVERLVNAAPTEAPRQQDGKTKGKQILAIDKTCREESLGQIFIGKAVRWHLFVEGPTRLLLMSAEWIVLIMKALNVPVSIMMTMLSALLRLYRYASQKRRKSPWH